MDKKIISDLEFIRDQKSPFSFFYFVFRYLINLSIYWRKHNKQLLISKTNFKWMKKKESISTKKIIYLFRFEKIKFIIIKLVSLKIYYNRLTLTFQNIFEIEIILCFCDFYKKKIWKESFKIKNMKTKNIKILWFIESLFINIW